MASTSASQPALPTQRQKLGRLNVVASSPPIKSEFAEPQSAIAAPSTPCKGRRSFSVATSDENDSIREQKKQRNRTSAVRHRRRKKETEDDLDSQEHELVARNEGLKRDIELVKNARLQLKSMLLAHSMCSFAPIDHYHMQSAQSVTAGSAMSSVTAASKAASQAASEGPTTPTVSASNNNSFHPIPAAETDPDNSTPYASTNSSHSSFSQDNLPAFASVNGMSMSLGGLPQLDGPGTLYSPVTSVSDMSTTSPTQPTQGITFQSAKARNMSDCSEDSGYQTAHGIHKQIASERPGNLHFQDSRETKSANFGQPGSEGIWSPLGESPDASHTTTLTTPDQETSPDFESEYLRQFSDLNGSIFDGMCCPMDTLMDKNLMASPVEDDGFLNLFFNGSD